MTSITAPVYSLSIPPTQFTTLDEANRYIRDVHRELETRFASINSILSSISAGNTGQTISSIESKTGDYTLTTSDYLILGDASSGNITLTLPTAASMTNSSFIIKKTDTSSNDIIIDADGSETIDGSTTVTLLGPTQVSVVIVSDGTNWYII